MFTKTPFNRSCIVVAISAITLLSSLETNAMNNAVKAKQIRQVNQTRYYPFVIEWDDAKSNVITDVSSLNGALEPVVAKNGHFYGRTTGKRIRFVGTNFTFANCFRSHEDAEKVAARVAKYGINIVRLHHMDNPWKGEGSIWDKNFPDHRHIDKTQLDHLDYLIAQLEKHGVYVDLNLHVSRQFSKEDGFPESAGKIPFDFDKRVDNFESRMIELQKEYAKDLLTHVNPYTKRSYANDPGVAIVEINNENSLLGDPWATLGGGLEKLPEPFLGELAGLWNKWLKSKYKTDAALKKAWTKNITPPGPSLVGASTEWILEKHGTEGALDAIRNGEDNVAPDAEINITKADGTGWHTQANIHGLTLTNNETYTVSFRAKADSNQSLAIGMSLDQEDWRNVGLNGNIDVTTEWKTFTTTFTAKGAVPGHCRFIIYIDKNINLEVSGLTIYPGVKVDNRSFGSLKDSSFKVPLLQEALAEQRKDWLLFLMDTELAYVGEMRGYLKNTLKVNANIIDSQLGFGGVPSIARENYMELADNHAYWCHPSFPHVQWDGNDWLIDNKSMVPALAKGDGGTIRDLAQYRIAGKPYIVTEYNHPAPNDFQSETTPLIYSFASAQDWDGVFLFDYGDYGAKAANDRIQSFFGIGSNPAKMAFLPSMSMLYRSGLMEPLRDEISKRLPITGSARVNYVVPSDIWKDAPDIYRTRISVVPIGTVAPVKKAEKTAVSKSPVKIELLHWGDAAGYFAVSPQAQVLTGFVGGQTVEFGPVTYAFDSFGNGFASLSLVAMDQAGIAKSGKLLLTIAGKAENQNMGWNTDRTSVGSQWGNGPVQLEAIPASVKIHIDGPRKVYALKPDGSHLAEVKSHYDNGVLTFRTGDNDSPWFEIVR